MIENPAWYVVHTRSQQDRLCADALERKGFAVYLPMRQTKIKHARREEIVMRPALGRYLFVGLDPDQPQFSEVKRSLGVEWMLQVVGSRMPLPIAPSIIEALRRAEDAGAFDDVPRHVVRLDLPKRGDVVRISDGPFAGMIAEVAKAPSEHRIEIVIRHARSASRVTAALAKLEKVA